MKKISIMILLLVAVLASCKKTPEVNLKYVDVERDLITVGTTTATIQCDYEYIATLKKAFLYYGEGTDTINTSVAEMSVVQKTLYVELSGLKENTTYSYYYEFANGFNSMRSVTKTFITGNNAPEGAINGLFTINANGDKVYFSKGNLQYRASTNTWRFAENQFDFVGDGNANISPTYDGWIDLFGWGTSGYNHGANCYQPWSTPVASINYYVYGKDTYNLYDSTGQADWGYNPISNGGNMGNQWRTLTNEEWRYVFKARTTASSLLYVMAKVNNVNGVVLLPDDWNNSTYNLNPSDNKISISQWVTLENTGAVFLPAAGYRNTTSVYEIGNSGDYWTASCLSSQNVYMMCFDDLVADDCHGTRGGGNSVRLVTTFRD